MRRFRLLALMLGAGTVAAACGGTSSSSGGTGGNARTLANAPVGGTIQLANVAGLTWTCVFNPYLPSPAPVAQGFINEPLIFVNALKNGETTPWLATAYDWTSNNTVLTFTIRSGVKFSDGTPMSVDDVVFTYQLLKQYPALDLNGIWSVLSDVKASGSDKVVLTFSAPAVTYFYFIADQVFIVPKHIWSQIAHPDTDQVTAPVGTGPYLMNKCSAQNIEYVRNPNFWQPGLPKIEKVEYPSYTQNDPANADLVASKAQWGSQYIPHIEGSYLKNPSHHTWSPPVAHVSLFLNNLKPPFDNPAIRKALAYAIDTAKIAANGETGQEPVGNQTGVVLPTFKDWYSKTLADDAKYSYGYHPDKALQMLAAAGYTKGADGQLKDAGGNQLTFKIINNAGYSDWVADLAVLVQEFKDLGINAVDGSEDGTPWQNDLNSGNFQAAIQSETGGPAPEYEFRQELCSCTSAPIGQTAGTNFERYNLNADGSPKDKTIDDLFNAYAATTDSAQQHDIVNKLQEVMLRDVPIIPLLGSVAWYQWDDSKIGGWETQDNPFANPQIGTAPDPEVMLLHLFQK